MSAGGGRLTSKSGIETSADGKAFIPSSKRADGSTRKEIRVRPGYKPPEDVETYKNRSADAWKTRGAGGVPGTESLATTNRVTESKGKNAKRREASRKKVDETNSSEVNLVSAMGNQSIAERTTLIEDRSEPSNLTANQASADTEDVERVKKIRNQLKKLKAVRDLIARRTAGEKLSHDQLMKIGKEPELLRDLRKLDYDGPELQQGIEDGNAIKVMESEHG